MEDTVESDPMVGPLLKLHPEIFTEHIDAAYMTIVVFVFYEMLKGDDSFWKPYFDIISPTDLPLLWTDHELLEC